MCTTVRPVLLRATIMTSTRPRGRRTSWIGARSPRPGTARTFFGLAPRAVVAAWTAFGLCLVVGMLGQVLDLPGWLTTVSPFEHTPQLPAADLTLAPLAILIAVAAGLVALGLAGFRRRDLAG